MSVQQGWKCSPGADALPVAWGVGVSGEAFVLSTIVSITAAPAASREGTIHAPGGCSSRSQVVFQVEVSSEGAIYSSVTHCTQSPAFQPCCQGFSGMVNVVPSSS